MNYTNVVRRHVTNPKIRTISSANVDRMAREDFREYVIWIYPRGVDESTEQRLWNGFVGMFQGIAIE